MSVYQGDFLGFSLGKEHSYNLNITRVSTNDRYTDNLTPAFTDAVVQVPGGDGTYYWDTYYTSKTFNIDFAFDDLRDEDLRQLSALFNFKGIQPLIFDEFPYKKYMVKCAQPPQLKYLCFDEMEFRIYKGEGNVQLIAYYPFAFATMNSEIAYIADGNPINNVGDLPAYMQITYKLSDVIGQNLSLSLETRFDHTLLGIFELNNITSQYKDDEYILIDTRTSLIEGLDKNHKKTKHLYNKFIINGDFFRPPVGQTLLLSNKPFQTAKYTPMYY